MITDVPTETDFRGGGIELLNIAWDSVVSLLINLDEALTEGWVSLDEVSGEYWKAASRTLATALALTQQSFELLIKGRICSVSPYLLLVGSAREWPSLSPGEAISFADLRTVDAGDLIRLHNAVTEPSIDLDFQERFESLRRKRNTFLHTVDKRLSVTAKEVLTSVLEGVHHLLPAERWLAIRTKHLENDAASVVFSPDFVEGRVIDEVSMLLEVLQPAEARKHFGIDKKQRFYNCPTCSRTYHNFKDRDAVTAQLSPNTPESTTLWCFVCQNGTAVIRKNCDAKDCPGNVIDEEEDSCLTCGRTQGGAA